MRFFLSRTSEVEKAPSIGPRTAPAASSAALPEGTPPAEGVPAAEGDGCSFEDRGLGDFTAAPMPQGKLLVRAAAVQEAGAYALVVHFHGGDAVRRLLAPDGWDFNLLTVDVGDGSGVYRKLTSSAAFFPALLGDADRAVSEALGRPARADRVILSSFSAGYGALGAILRAPPPDRRIAGLVLLDSLHAAFVRSPDGSGESPDPASLEPFVDAARRARDGRDPFFFGMTHTAIVPSGYASTTVCADAVLASIGEARSEVGWAGEGPLPIASQLQKGKLVVRGYEGGTKEAHCDQLRLLPGLLRELTAARD